MFLPITKVLIRLWYWEINAFNYKINLVNNNDHHSHVISFFFINSFIFYLLRCVIFSLFQFDLKYIWKLLTLRTFLIIIPHSSGSEKIFSTNGKFCGTHWVFQVVYFLRHIVSRADPGNATVYNIIWS